MLIKLLSGDTPRSGLLAVLLLVILISLAFAPFYVAWALLLRLRRRGTRTAWVRTGRE